MRRGIAQAGIDRHVAASLEAADTAWNSELGFHRLGVSRSVRVVITVVVEFSGRARSSGMARGSRRGRLWLQCRREGSAVRRRM